MPNYTKKGIRNRLETIFNWISSLQKKGKITNQKANKAYSSITYLISILESK